ncbi:MAG TPA: hypothetical protein ENG83_10815 [Nitrospirae bacterium]|nr:hypothetical protein BMS3Abin06_01560 [bacterium BMS3Abin06]HDH12663.1 hypothetical protein [Nitrospirota bacterium]HDY99971.1 hypothetical protein [Nitrospirota bacterium]
MDFKLVIEKLLTSFNEQGVHYALIGGMALGAWGVPRGTVDIDFLVNRDDMEKVDAIMQKLGYECKYKTENVSQYLSPLNIFGEVDFLHAFRSPSLSMLQRAVDGGIFNGSITIKVLKVEDLIGFKVQAMANDESRKPVDLADIESLMSEHKSRIDWSVVEEYFVLFGLDELFNELRGKYGND